MTWIHKKTFIFIILTIIIIVAMATFFIFRNKKVENQNFQKITNSKLIIYNNEKYEIIPSDMIKKGSNYADILDSLHMNYNVKKEYIKEKVGELEEGGSIYKTESGIDKVIIVKDYNNEYVFAFRL